MQNQPPNMMSDMLCLQGVVLLCAVPDIKSNVRNAECFQSVLLMGPRLMGR